MKCWKHVDNILSFCFEPRMIMMMENCEAIRHFRWNGIFWFGVLVIKSLPGLRQVILNERRSTFVRIYLYDYNEANWEVYSLWFVFDRSLFVVPALLELFCTKNCRFVSCWNLMLLRIWRLLDLELNGWLLHSDIKWFACTL